jgi:hypothetical protein
VPDDAVTVTVALAVMVPVNPFMLAEIVVVPAVSAVARPVELTLATAGALEVHVTESVSSCVLDGWPLPCPTVPVAVNCTVWPTERDCVVGETARESTREFVQPAMGRIRAIRRIARGEKRSCMVNLRNLQPVLTSIQRRHGRLSLAYTPSNIGHRNSRYCSTNVLLSCSAPRQSLSPLKLLQTGVTDVIDGLFSSAKNGPRAGI